MPDREILPDRLARLRARYPGSDPDMVAEVVRSVLNAMRGDLSALEAALLGEVEELGRAIALAKEEIAALQVGDITESHIPSATDELDAIVAHTAAATHSILESCETLDAVAAEIAGDPALRLQDATTRIYEACSFQDITGQRITKVVGTLKMIEARVARIIARFGPSLRDPDPSRRSVPACGASLLNGPQLPMAAMDQSDIDRLLASFD